MCARALQELHWMRTEDRRNLEPPSSTLKDLFLGGGGWSKQFQTSLLSPAEAFVLSKVPETDRIIGQQVKFSCVWLRFVIPSKIPIKTHAKCSQNPGLVNQFSATPQGQLNWTGPIANSSDQMRRLKPALLDLRGFQLGATRKKAGRCHGSTLKTHTRKFGR